MTIPARGERPYRVLAVVGLGTLLTAISSSSANLALPDIGRDFGVALGGSRWVVMAFLVTVTAALPIAGRVGDLVGYGRLFVAGYALLALASGGCAAAPSLSALVAARVVQGLAGAMVMAAGPALLTTAFSPSHRGRALGMLGTSTYVGLSIGPPVGGLILTAAGWRWVFFIGAPVALLVTAIGWRVLPGVARRSAGARAGRAPFASLALFRSRTFSSSAIAAALNYTALFIPLILVPFVLVEGHGLEERDAGLLLAVQPIAMALTAAPAGWLSDALGSRGLAVGGMIAVAAGALGMSFTGPASSPAAIAAWHGVMGLGTGVFVTPNSSALMGAAPPEQQGTAGGVMALARNLGMMIGVSSATAIFAAAGGSTGHAWDGADYGAFRVALVAAAVVAAAGAVAASLKGPRREV
jgi:MFS family permease